MQESYDVCYLERQNILVFNDVKFVGSFELSWSKVATMAF